MNPDDEHSLKHQEDKEKEIVDRHIGQEENSQIEERGESSAFSLLNFTETMNNKQNCNIQSDSDNEDFSIAVKTRKSTRPLEDSDSEAMPEETTEENNQFTMPNSTEVSLHLLNTAEKEDTKWDSDCSDGQSEKCPICLSKFHGQEIGTPESCDHSFCLECLLEWEQKVNTCPVDRLPFLLILVRQKLDGKIKRRIPVSSHKSADAWLEQDNDGDEGDLTYCEVCGHCDREDRLLLCDSCDLGYHCECLDPPLEMIPVGEWFCPGCDTNKWPEHCMFFIYSNLTEDMLLDFREMLRSRFRPGSSVFQHRVIARTLASETVRHRIQRRREAQLESLRNSYSVDDATVITSVTKRRFAHRLGLQRTTQSVLQPSGIPYTDILALASASYQDDEVSYNSSTDDDDDDNDIGYTNDKYQQNANAGFQWNRSASSANSRSSRTQRLRVPSPPANHGSIDILNTILQTQSLLHSNSQDITIEKDGSLTLKPAGSTQQRPQNPQGRSASSDKYGSLPSSASCSSKPTNNEPQIDQWYGLNSSNRQARVSDSYSGNRYDGQHPVHYASSLCDESKKKEYQHSNRTKDAKTQSEDEVDIYSDIESLGDEIVEEPDVPNNEHCNITNIYRSDLHLDAMEEDSDSSENELIIDEDAKVEEEDSHSEQWNEENYNSHSLQEEGDHNDSSPLKGSNYNNYTVQDESNHGSFSAQEESNPNFSLQGSSHNNSSQEESDHIDFSFKQENKSQLDAITSPCNPYQEFVNNEAVDILSQNICGPKSCDTVNSEASAEEMMDDNEEGDGGNEDDDELSDNYNDTISNVQENEGSSDEEQINKMSNEESMSPNNVSIAPLSETAAEHEVNLVSEQRTSFAEHVSMYKSGESGEYIPKEESIDEYNYEQETNITKIVDGQIDLKKSDSEVFSNVTEENSVCSSPLNDDRSVCTEEENESQESDIKSISEKEEIAITFSETSVIGSCIDSKVHSSNFETPKTDETLAYHSDDGNQNINVYDQQGDSSKFTETHHSIMPAEDVEDISEAGSDDIKFKDGIEDWDIEVAEHVDNKQVENLEEMDEREIDVDDVEQRVAKLFEDEDLSPQHGKTSSQLVKVNKTKRTCIEDHSFVNRPSALEEEREEGEIIEEAPPKHHKSRSRKSHHRESTHHHHDEIEDYSDFAPRVNISDLPKIPKIKKDKTKVENQEEMLPVSKRTSVLSRIDIGVSSEISWKRLSKSTRERSYRDGRPKDDRLLFADREIKQKIKKSDDHQRKDDDRHNKEERHKRPENEKWRDKSDREHSKDRNDKQRESSRDKSEKRLEKDWRSEKSHDKKDEKSFEKFHREEKSHRDKHKHKHKEKDVNKDHKSDKDKSQEKEKHSYLHHSHEREHSKQKDRKPKQSETKLKEVISKKEIKKEKLEKAQERKGTKHERKRHDESHRHYEHRRKEELRYPTITAIESKEIYTKGDSIIINVNFNRSAEKEMAIEEEKCVPKDIKRTKLKDKFPSDKRFEKADMKYSKQKHSSHLIDQTEINLSKQSPSERCEQKKKSAEKVQIGEMLWKETEDLTQTNDDIEDRLNDDDQLSNFKSHSSPASCISEQSEKMSDVVAKEVKSKILLSPYDDENNGSPSSVLHSSPIRRSPRSPSPPSPTENDSYDPCDPTASPFLQKGSPLSPENTLSSLESRPVPPPSPELPPLPLDPEPIIQDKCIGADEILEKTLNPNLSSSDSVQVPSTCTPISSTSQSQIPHFSLPNVKVPPPNYSHKLSCGIAAQNSNIQVSSPAIPNWNSGNVQLLFATHGGQPSAQGCYVPSHLTQGALPASQPGAFAQTPVAAVPQTLIHSSGQSTLFMTTIPDIRVPPPQISLNLNQQPHTPQPVVATSSAAAVKSSPDVTDVVDMEVESPYTPGDSPISSDKSVSQKQSNVLSKGKFDMLLSSLVKEHYCSTSASGSFKRHHDDARSLAEKVKQSQMFSKSVISVLDKMNKRLLVSKKLQQSCSSAKRSKLESKLLDPNRSRYNRIDTTKSVSKKESKQDKKDTNRTGEAQKTAVDDLPSSAVEMQFLKKLNRQERVVEEVKLCLKPYYSRREINKEEYKEIMRKSVPKVCHNRSGDINPVKIKTLIEGYIKKFKHHRKKASKMQKAKIS